MATNQSLLADEKAKTLLQNLISETIRPKDMLPSEAISLEVMRDAWTEFEDQLDPANVQWGDVSPELVDDMVCYIRQLARGDEASTSKQIPRPVIITRIKRYYRAQRQQKQKASSPTRRRRRRFQNRKNRLTM
ncbi:hypothetical protein P5673_020884, partial [Acropora cervicornis]